MFGKSYRILFGKGSSAKEFNSKSGPNQPLQIRFMVQKQHTPEPNGTKISMYNLNKESRAQCEEIDTFAELYAGYNDMGEPGLISAGYVVDAYTRSDGQSGDVVTEIELYEGWLPLRDTVLSMSYKKGASAHQLIRSVASAMGCAVSIARGAPDYTWQSGFSYQGTAHGALTKACAAAGLRWSIQDGKLQVTQFLNSTQKKAALIGEGSGMIGSPERIYKSAGEAQRRYGGSEKRPENSTTVVSNNPDKQKKRGWRVRSQLRSDVLPGDLVVIESSAVTGTFMVDKLSHSGMFMGGDWTTTLELYEDTTGKYTYTRA